MNWNLTIRGKWIGQYYCLPSCWLLLSGIYVPGLGIYMWCCHVWQCHVSRSRGFSNSWCVACYPFFIPILGLLTNYNCSWRHHLTFSGTLSVLKFIFWYFWLPLIYFALPIGGCYCPRTCLGDSCHIKILGWWVLIFWMPLFNNSLQSLI